MSPMPSPVPITRARRLVRVHVLNSDGVPYCGARYKSYPAEQPPQDAMFCTRCTRLARAANERAFIQSLERQEIKAARDRRARTAYDTWAHRSLPIPSEAFDALPDRQKQAWREVVEFFESEFKENADATR